MADAENPASSKGAKARETAGSLQAAFLVATLPPLEVASLASGSAK